MVKGQAPTIYGDGHQTRDFTYVMDIVEATLAACQSSLASAQVINVGGGRQTGVNELVAKLNKTLGNKIQGESRGAPQGRGAPRPSRYLQSQGDLRLQPKS